MRDRPCPTRPLALLGVTLLEEPILRCYRHLEMEVRPAHRTQPYKMAYLRAALPQVASGVNHYCFSGDVLRPFQKPYHGLRHGFRGARGL